MLDATAHLVDRARRRGEHITVVIFDIDDFKSVDDRDGHPAGDRLLVGLSARWSRQAPAGSVLARLGGDEFVMGLSGYDHESASALAGVMTADHDVGVTYGVAVGPPDPDVLESLIQKQTPTCTGEKPVRGRPSSAVVRGFAGTLLCYRAAPA